MTYQVLPEKSAWLYANVSDIKNLVGDELVASAIKSAMAELGPNEVTNRTKIEPLAQQKLAESLVQKYGDDVVFVNKVVINDMNFEDAYNEAIQQKSIAQQNADKQKIENEAAIAKAEADKQVAITNAEAEAPEDFHCRRCTGRGKPQTGGKPVRYADRLPEDPEVGW